jgi:hypothetical protein
MNNSACVSKLALIAVLSVALEGCRYGNASSSVYENERISFRTEYKATYDKIQNDKKYDSITNGYRDRIGDLQELTQGTYQKVLAWREKWAKTESAKAYVADVKTFCNKWIEHLRAEYNKEIFHGSDGPYLHASELMVFYEKSICRLLMSDEELDRWNRIRNMTWNLHGKTASFRDGNTSVKLPFRIFEPNPFNENLTWFAFIDENSLLSANGSDYALVWLAGDGNFSSCPTSTEEVVLVEIRDGKVSRHIGLHNILNPDISFSGDGNMLLVTAESGYYEDVRYTIDLRSMKIVRAQSSFPSGFLSDGYGRFLNGN